MDYAVLTAAQREEIARQRVAQLEGEHYQHSNALGEAFADPNDTTNGAEHARNIKTLEARLRVARAQLEKASADVAGDALTEAPAGE
jgi:hypothetical protein